MDWSQQDADKVVEKVMAKAATDMAFRKRLLANPTAAVKELTGKDLPAGMKIKVIENDPGVDQTFVLPDFMGESLSEKDLEAVAGGCGTDKCTRS